MDIHNPEYLEPRIADLAKKRNCTLVDVLDSIVTTLEYNPELIWRDSDRRDFQNLSPVRTDREARLPSLSACSASISRFTCRKSWSSLTGNTRWLGI